MAIRSRNFSDVCHMGVTSSDRGPSSNIWSNCPWFELQNNPFKGFHVCEDFTGSAFTQAANIAAGAAGGIKTGPWVAFTGATAGSLISQEVDEPYGVLQLQTTTNDETVCLSAFGGVPTSTYTYNGGQFVFESGKRIWMESRIKLPAITDDLEGVFVGFGQEGLAATVAIIGADDALADVDLVGFHKHADDSHTAAASLDIKYKTNGDSQTGGTKALATAHTFVADTYVKIGLYCDGVNVFFYVNNVLKKTLPISTTYFPDGEEMAFYAALTNKGGGDAMLNIDWVRLACEF